jgi:hypothetical protein
MAEEKKTRAKSSESSNEASPRPHLPDPKYPGPYRPFVDPGWDEAWWWLGIPIVVTVFVIGTYQFNPEFYDHWVIPEGYGVLEMSHFLMPMGGMIIALRLLAHRFVRARPLTFVVALLGALSCLYIGGEETSWGQHFFHWNTPEYWLEVNRQQETNLHNTYAVFEKTPRAILEIGIFIGGVLVPLAAWFDRRVRTNRFSLFLPASALVPAAIGALGWKFSDMLYTRGLIPELVGRPSETVETYLYFFILAYLIVFTRRIHALEAEAKSS